MVAVYGSKRWIILAGQYPSRLRVRTLRAKRSSPSPCGAQKVIGSTAVSKGLSFEDFAGPAILMR